MRARPAALLVLAALAWGAAARAGDPPAAAPPAAPMTDEEVVRMVAAGTPLIEILDAIRSRPAAYDLSEDMVAELKRAGVPEQVVTAMRARQSAPPVAPEADRPRTGTLRVAVDFEGTRTLHVPAYADEDLKDRLSLPKETSAREVKDLAVFVACVTSVHVPDAWRSKTPLGRDMTATPRHEMLAFVAGDTPEGKAPRLTVPKSFDVDLDDVEPHDLVAGIAARIGDRWYTLSISKPQKVEVKAGMPPIAVRLRKGSVPFAFEVTVGSGVKAGRS